MDYSNKSLEELQEELEKIKNEITKKKAEKKTERKKQKDNEQSIPEDMIKTAEYGWVKLLPVGPGDVVYTWSIKCSGIRGRVCDYLAVSYPNRTSKDVYSFGQNDPRWINPSVKVIPIYMRASYYNQLGECVFLSKEEAEQAMMNWLYKNFTDEEIENLWLIETDAENDPVSHKKKEKEERE